MIRMTGGVRQEMAAELRCELVCRCVCAVWECVCAKLIGWRMRLIFLCEKVASAECSECSRGRYQL